MLLISHQCKVSQTISINHVNISYMLFILLYLYITVPVYSDTAPQVQLLKSGTPVKSCVVFVSKFSFVYLNWWLNVVFYCHATAWKGRSSLATSCSELFARSDWSYNIK